MDIITVADLASHLEDTTITTSTRAASVVELTNGLITDSWVSPIDPPPTYVKILAYTVAARALRARPTSGTLESLTRSFDDSSRTERYVVPEVADPDAPDVYLTDEELARLNRTAVRAKVGSVPLRVRGFTDC